MTFLGSVAIGILLLVGYVICRITSLTDRLSVLDVFSPFQYFSYARIVHGQGLNLLVTVLVLVLFGVLVVWTISRISGAISSVNGSTP